jgi:CSLREA domain-containing protein
MPAWQKGRAVMGVALAMVRRSLAVPLAAGVVLTAPSVVSVAVAAGRPAARVSFEVTTTADAHDAQPGDRRCADSGDQCTLRAAVEEEAAAQPLGIAVSITLPAGTYPLILGSLDFDGGPVSVAGAGARSAVIEATGEFRVLDVGSAATADGSPAIDHGGTRATGCPATDQRGVSRPQGPACDIGAVEVQVTS